MTDVANSTSAFPHIDDSARPQDDFQRHVNGRWLATAEIPSDLDSYGSFIELRDKAEADVRAILDEASDGAFAGTAFSAVAARIGGFYAAFMDAERAEQSGLEPLRPFLDEVDAVTEVGALVELSARWQRYGMDGIFAAGALRDAGDPERMLWHIIQDGIGLPDESYYREETHAETLKAYEQHLARMLSLGEVAEGEQAEGAAAAVVALEKRIASYHWDVVTTRDAQKRYNLKSGDEVIELMPLITRAFAGWGLQERHTQEIVLTQPDVLPGVQAALAEEPLEAWKNWLKLQVIRWAAPLLHSALVQEHFDFYSRTLNGTPELKERWKRGVALTNGHLGEDVAQIYVDRHYPPQAREAMDELIEALLEAYRRSISTLEWMGEETRGKALEKLGTFRPMVGFPARWIDYSAVEVDPEDSLGNVARAAEFEWGRDIAKLDDGPDPEEWHMTPQTVNAYYHPLENVICFPAAILQPPFFSAERDMAQNFGAIGAVIGHEIGHGFDDQGSRFGADGSLTNWWTEEDRAAFEQRTAKLVDQYSELSPSVLDDEHTVNGELTLGENIGDIGGVGISHKAYTLWLAVQKQGVGIRQADPAAAETHAASSDGDAGLGSGSAADAATAAVVDPDEVEGYTGDQRFFFSWAQAWRHIVRPERALTLLSVDPHSPAEIRANQVVKNIDAFHEAFGTVPGDRMHLTVEDRVTIW